jgi:hypothetical protein
MTEEQRLEIGRSSAMQMVAVSGNVIWASFNSILLANAALVTVSGVVEASTALRPHVAAWTASILAGAGLAVCLVWLCSVMRNFEYQRYYLECAKFYEDKLLNQSGIKVIEMGSVYGDGGKVLVGKSTLQMPWVLGVLKIKYLAIMIITVFAMLYLFIFLLSIF